MLGGNFRKFSLIVNITDNLGSSVDLNEAMHATPRVEVREAITKRQVTKSKEKDDGGKGR